MRLTQQKKLFFLTTLLSVGISQNIQCMEDDCNPILKKLHGLSKLTINGSEKEKVKIERILKNIKLYRQKIYNNALADTSHFQLYEAARTGDEKLVEILLFLGTNPNTQVEKVFDTSTPLIIATEKGHCGVVEKLLQHKDIDVDKPTSNTGETALHFAARKNKVDIAKRLIVAKASKNARMYVWDKEGNHFTSTGPTAYEVAQKNEFKEIAELLKPQE